MTIVSDWTEARVEMLMELHAEKKSSALIADAINSETGSSFSRNAVISKLHRSGLRGNGRVAAVTTTRRKRPGRGMHLRSKNGNWRGGPSLPAEPVPPPIVFTTEHKCGFFQLGNTSCRWPLWEGDEPLSERFYCGIPEADMDDHRAYCTGHSFVAHQGSPALGQAAE